MIMFFQINSETHNNKIPVTSNCVDSSIKIDFLLDGDKRLTSQQLMEQRTENVDYQLSSSPAAEEQHAITLPSSHLDVQCIMTRGSYAAASSCSNILSSQDEQQILQSTLDPTAQSFSPARHERSCSNAELREDDEADFLPQSPEIVTAILNDHDEIWFETSSDFIHPMVTEENILLNTLTAPQPDIPSQQTEDRSCKKDTSKENSELIITTQTSDNILPHSIHCPVADCYNPNNTSQQQLSSDEDEEILQSVNVIKKYRHSKKNKKPYSQRGKCTNNKL